LGRIERTFKAGSDARGQNREKRTVTRGEGKFKVNRCRCGE